MTLLLAEAARLKSDFGVETPERIRYSVVDDVLPSDVMETAYSQLPTLGCMVRRADLRKRKYVSANIGGLNTQIVDIVLAFADSGHRRGDNGGAITSMQTLRSITAALLSCCRETLCAPT